MSDEQDLSLREQLTESFKAAETSQDIVTTSQDIVPAADEVPEPVFERPRSWRKEIADDAWNALPKDIKAEVLRREKEISDKLQADAESRKLAEAFQRTVQPYEMYLREAGVDGIQAVQHLLGTVHALKTAPAMQKAQMIAQIARGYGVDLRELDSALFQLYGGKPAEPSMQEMIQRGIQEAMAPYMQQQHNQAINRTLYDVQSFVTDPANEFMSDSLRETMGALISVAAAQNRDMTLKQAYDQACALNMEVQEKIRLKQQEKARAAAQQSKAAALSPPANSPAGNGQKNPDDMSLREQLRAQFKAAGMI